MREGENGENEQEARGKRGSPTLGKRGAEKKIWGHREGSREDRRLDKRSTDAAGDGWRRREVGRAKRGAGPAKRVTGRGGGRERGAQRARDGSGRGAPRPGRCGAVASSRRSRRPRRPRQNPQPNDRGPSEPTQGGRQLAARGSRGRRAAARVAAHGAPRALIDLSAQASQQPLRLLCRPDSRAGPSGWSAPPAPGGSHWSPGSLLGAPLRSPAGIARPRGCPPPGPPLWAPCQSRQCSPCCWSCTSAPRAPALARGCPQSLPHPLPRAHQGKRRRVREGSLQGAGLGHRGHPQVGIESSAATSRKPARAFQGHEMNCGLRPWKELGDSYQSWE